MASTQSKFPIFIAATIGAAGAYYIVSPKVERSGKTPGPTPTEGRGQSAISGKQNEESPSSHSPHPALKYGGAAPGDDKTTTVAGTSQQSRKSYSADHDVKTRDNPKGQDGTNGGGVGVAEMRERKMQGQGLPSPQGGDTKAQSVEVQQGYNDGQGPKQSRGWFGFGGSK
ncbi:hypothetical protein I316_01615 [Kwoniella heveanensis BCC8398]|uniref:Uncharacterized protein n=1 Tax=Kwoniella heveanensis BCC8398 TaxID=1296120 RepID=A0A1B9GZA6_9TREE|nr:hypothetical protein I316_01615 [Kwoniella heveanensis BCC8398]